MTVLQLLRRLNRKSKLLIAAGLLLVAVSSLSAWLALQATASVIDALGSHAQHEVLVWGLLLIAATLITNGASALAFYLGSAQSSVIEYELGRTLLSAVGRLPLKYFETDAYYRKLALARTASLRELAVGLEECQSFIIALLQVLVSIAAIGHLSTLVIMLILLAGIAVRAYTNSYYTKALVNRTECNAPKQRRLNYLKHQFMDRTAIKEIYLWDYGQQLAASYQADVKVVQATNNRYRLKLLATLTRNGIVEYLLYSMALILAISDYLDGGLTIGVVGALFVGIRNLIQAVNTMSWRFRSVREWLVGMSYYLEFIRIGEQEGDLQPFTAAPSLSDKPLIAENVSYCYPRRNTNAVSRASLTIQPGERIVIIGRNGSGKTTLTKLLLGLLEPTEGQINHNLLAYELPLAAVVNQDYLKYSLSVRENVAAGWLPSLHSDAAINDALRRAEASFVFDLPEGIETVLGKLNGNVDLSEGQWQRIALARAAVSPAPFVFFDEPTHSLDPIAELELSKQLESIIGERTAIIVTHRLGLTRLADRILVMQDGSIVEQGTREELLKARGEFWRLYQQQVGWYQ